MSANPAALRGLPENARGARGTPLHGSSARTSLMLRTIVLLRTIRTQRSFSKRWVPRQDMSRATFLRQRTGPMFRKKTSRRRHSAGRDRRILKRRRQLGIIDPSFIEREVFYAG